MTTIKNIDYKDTFIVRHPVLRAGNPIESCFFDGDDLETTTHFGFFVVDKLIGVISVYQNKNLTFNADNQYQIRGMAVLQDEQTQGCGKQLLERAESDCIAKNAEIIWFNAREKAVGFYQKSGYQIIGNPFEIAGIGTHYIMYKKIGQ